MIVPPVDDGDGGLRAAQRPGAGEAAEAGADDDDAGCSGAAFIRAPATLALLTAGEVGDVGAGLLVGAAEDAVAAGGLGLVEPAVGRLQQAGEVDAVERRAGDADGRGDRGGRARQRRRDPAPEALGGEHRRAVGETVAEHDDLLAAIAVDAVGLAGGLADQGRDLAEDIVAGRMAVAFVERAEPVDVDDHQA